MTGGAADPIPWTRAGFWPRYWVTLRPYLFFVSGAAGWVGLALATDLRGWSLASAAGAFFFAYGVGQALTDVFQTDTDAVSAPYRPLPRGEISRASVAGVSLFGLTLCSAVFGLLNPWTLAVSGLAVVGLATYTPMKRRWWGGPIWNSAIMALLPWIGWLCQGGRPWEVIGEGRVLLAMGSVFGTRPIVRQVTKRSPSASVAPGRSPRVLAFSFQVSSARGVLSVLYGGLRTLASPCGGWA